MLVMVASFSRFITATMIPSRTTADLLAEHWRLLSGLGAIPGRLVWDNEPGIGRGAKLTTEARVFAGSHRYAVAKHSDVAGCILYTDRGSQFRNRKYLRALNYHGIVGSMGRVGADGDYAAMEFHLIIAEQRPGSESLSYPRGTTHRNRHLARRHLLPTHQARCPRPIDAHQI